MNNGLSAEINTVLHTSNVTNQTNGLTWWYNTLLVLN